MTHKEKFIAALERKPFKGRVPHFELVFFLTMEALGRIHPGDRLYRKWQQASEKEKDLHRRDIADLHKSYAEMFEHSAVFFYSPAGWEVEDERIALDHFKEMTKNQYFTALHGDATIPIPEGNQMMELIGRIADEPEKVKDEVKLRVENAVKRAEKIKKWNNVDGFCLCDDYCFNDRPFFSPAMFDEFITPYMTELIKAYREMGFYVIKHTDGNIMPILDSLVSANPHALHSLDPQGHVDIAEVKKLVGNKVCLIGNVNCGLLQTGTEKEVVDSCMYALKHGMPGGGYVFSTSNCIYVGLSLDRYRLMLDVWRKHGNYI